MNRSVDIMHCPSGADLNWVVHTHNNFGTLHELVFAEEGMYDIMPMYANKLSIFVPNTDLENYQNLFNDLHNKLKDNPLDDKNIHINYFVFKVNTLIQPYSLKMTFLPCINNKYQGFNIKLNW